MFLSLSLSLSRRRRSDKPYISGSSRSRPAPPIAYSKTRNGNKITGLGGNNSSKFDSIKVCTTTGTSLIALC